MLARPKPKVKFEIVDVELGAVFYCDTPAMRDDYVTTIENLGHRAIVHEYTEDKRNGISE